MIIGANYPTPVTVNGILCRNCTDVDNAKKHIDPAHPKSGPYGINAKSDPTAKAATSAAITFGGNLRSLNEKPATAGSTAAPSNGEAATQTTSGNAIGTQLDVTA